MVVVVLSAVPPSLRGDVSKWLFEIGTGVYVGNLSARVRENLWTRIEQNIKKGRALMVYSAANEQRFEFKVTDKYGEVLDLDGLEFLFHSNNPSVSNKIQQCYVIVDVETTGLDPEKSQITEIGALKIAAGNPAETFQHYLKISGSVPQKIVELTGITGDILNQKGEDKQHVLSEFKKFTANSTIICHNAKFDLEFLKQAYEQQGMEWKYDSVIDTLQLARKKDPNLKSYRLKYLLKHYNLSEEQSHEALNDCYDTWRLFDKLNKI